MKPLTQPGATDETGPQVRVETQPSRAPAKLRLGVVGVGHLGRIHARLAQQAADVQLVGVADPRAEVREEVAAEAGTRPFANFLELARQIDAAIIATPTQAHTSVALELASRGIHLLVEKPLARTGADAARLVSACRHRGVTLQVGHVERFNPALRKALPHIEEPKYIEAIRVSGYPFRSTDIGVVLDLMIHDLDVVLSLVQAPVRAIDALGLSVLGSYEDVAQARLTFANGCVANLTASRVSYVAKRSMQVWTPRSFAAVDFGRRATTLVHPNLRILDRNFQLDALSDEEKPHLKDHLFDELLAKQTVDAADCNAIAEEHEDFFTAIRTGREPTVPGEQGRDAVAVAERILQSIAEHAWDGSTSGRKGAFAKPDPPVLQGPHWAGVPTRRRAG
jgi:predicted dehydrogenase